MSDKLQIPPIRSPIADQNDDATKDWYYFLRQAGDQINKNTAAIEVLEGGEDGGGAAGGIPPDVTVSGVTVGGRLVSHNTAAAFAGTINFPTTDSNYVRLALAEVEFEFPNGSRIIIRRYPKPVPPATSISFSDLWDDRILLGTTAVPGCKLRFFTTSGSGDFGLDPAVVPITLPAIAITAVSATETKATTGPNHRWQTKDTRQVHSVVPVTVTGPAGVSFYCTYWTNHPATSPNSDQRWHGWFAVNGTTTIPIGDEGSNTELYSPVTADEPWTVTVQIGTIDSNVAPSGGTTVAIVGDGPSSNVARIQPPATGLITSINVPAPGPNPFPYDLLESNGINHYWSIGFVTVNTTASYDAVNVFTVILTAQDLGSSGTPIGPEHIYGTPLPIKGTLNFGKLDGPYGDKADPARSASIGGVRLKAYLGNRTNETTAAWQDPNAATLQATLDVTVAVGGAIPGGSIPPGAIEAPGTPTVGTITYKWVEITDLAPNETCAFELLIPVTPPSPLGSYAGAHVYLEVPDGSAYTGFTFVLGGGKLGTDRSSSIWRPIDYGQYPYDGKASQTLRVRVPNVPVSAGTTMNVRVYVQPYSAIYDARPVRSGEAGASPSWVVTIAPQQQSKPNSGANITAYMVTSLTASAGTPQLVNNRMQTPITVTVNLSTVPSPLPVGWGYQLLAYLGGDVTATPVWTSDVLQKSGQILAAGDDGLSGPHTFGPITPAAQTSVVIYAVAGLLAADGVTFTQNNLVVGITASTAVTIGASINGVTVAEVGARYQSPPGGNTYCTIRTTVSQVGVTNATVWFSFNGGSSWVWQGVFPFLSSSFQDITVLIPTGTSSFLAKVAAGSYLSDAAPPASAVASNTLSLSIPAPSATAATLTITNSAGAAPTQTNIFMGRGPAGPWAQVFFTIQTPGAADTAPYYYDWWLQWVDSGGTAINPGNILNTSGWQHYWETWPNDGNLYRNDLKINYPGVANAYLEIRVYGRSRNSAGSQPPFAGDAGAVPVQWPGGLTYYRLQVGLPPGEDQVTNSNGDLNSNPATSLLANWSFLFNNAGYWIQGGNRSGTGYLNSWNSASSASSDIECRSDGGASGNNYMRLTGQNTGISQTVAVTRNQQMYFSMAARSSNHSTGHGCGIYIDWLDANRASITPFTTNIGTVGGYVSAWTPLAVTGYVTVPNNAAFAIVRVSTSASEPAGGYWDIDDVVMQAVLSQNVGGNVAEVVQGGSSGSYGAFRATAVAYSAVYGQDFTTMTGGSAGQTLLLRNNEILESQTQGSAGVGEFAICTISGGSRYHSFVIALQDSGIQIAQHIAGVVNVGYNGTVQAAYTANKAVKNGLIIN